MNLDYEFKSANVFTSFWNCFDRAVEFAAVNNNNNDLTFMETDEEKKTFDDLKLVSNW